MKYYRCPKCENNILLVFPTIGFFLEPGEDLLRPGEQVTRSELHHDTFTICWRCGHDGHLSEFEASEVPSDAQ